MQSLLNNDELRLFLEGLDYPIEGCVVCSAYEMTDHDAFPVVVYDEVYNAPYSRPMTTEEGLSQGATQLGYSITVIARDCMTKDDILLSREAACRALATTIDDAMFAHYGMHRDDTGACIPLDATCNVMTVRYSCVIDAHDYTYSTR